MLKNSNVVYGTANVLVPVKLNFGQFFLDKLWEFKDKICLINAASDESVTYGEILQSAMNLAVSLKHMGVGKGQTVALCSENRNEFFPTVFGVAFTGAVLTTINIGYARGELEHVMSISKPRMIFCSPLTYKLHEKTLKSFKFLKNVFVFGDEKPANAVLYKELVTPNNGMGLKNNVTYREFEAVDVTGQVDTLFILYSSGTTGLPKGVKLTHVNVLTACCFPPSSSPSIEALAVAPWFHAMGLIGSLVGMAFGKTTIYLPKFEMELYLKSIERYKVTHLVVTPPLLVALCKADHKYDISGVKIINSGAAPLNEDTLPALTTKFPHATVMQGYGLTEVTLATTRFTYDQPHLIKPGGVGYVVIGSVKVADVKTRACLGPNQRGEICIKSPLVMKGYVGRGPGEDIDDEGYLKTGDIGYYDEDRCFFIVDRLKELIKYKGYQVPPAEIEAVLLQHEGIRDAGVVGVKHVDAGEVPMAFVARQPGSGVTETEVQRFVADRLSNPKHLRGGVRFVEEIPRNASGKILRKVLRKMAGSRSKL